MSRTIIQCPCCAMPITREQIASMLGSLGKGQRKNFSEAERARRRDRLAEARKKRRKPPTA